MKSIDQLKQTPNLCVTGRMTRNGLDMFHVYEGFVDWPGFKGSVIFGYDEAHLMEHVSVSCHNRKKLPTWDDMCKLKKMFFNDDEMVVQIHPSEENYLHGVSRPGFKTLENVLHLWRPMDGDFSILNTPERWQ